MRRKSCSDVGLSSTRTNHFFLLDTKVEMTSLNNLISNPEWDWMLLTPFRSSMSTWSWDGIVHKMLEELQWNARSALKARLISDTLGMHFSSQRLIQLKTYHTP